MTQEHPCWLGARAHPGTHRHRLTGDRGGLRECGDAILIDNRIIYSIEARVKIPCLRWPLPPPFPTLTQWPDGLTVPTVHRAEKQPAHLPFVPYPQTSQACRETLHGPNSRRIGPTVARCHLPLWAFAVCVVMKKEKRKICGLYLETFIARLQKSQIEQ